MNFFTKVHELFRQKEQIVKKPDKHDANLQKNSTLYFQIGLIICLLTTNFMFEMYFETKEVQKPDYGVIDEPPTYIAPPTVIKERVAMVKTKKPVVRPRLVKPPVVVKDYKETPKDPEPEISEPVINTSPPKPLPPIPVKKDSKVMSLNMVSEVPVFPGCEDLTTNAERLKCLSNKLRKHVQRKFDTDIAESKGLTGKQKIQVEFTVDDIGNVTNIKTRSPHPALDKEAKYVISKIPQMRPGRHNDKNVSVKYYLPIVFQVQY